MATEIKIRCLTPKVIENIDLIAKKKGFKSRQEYLKKHLENLSVIEELNDKDEQYRILVEKVIKVLEYNTSALKKFMDENLIDIN